MRYISNILLTFLTIFFVSFFVIVPLSPVLADTGMPKLQIDIPTIRFSPANPCTTVGDESKLCVNWIAEYIAGIYKYAIGIVGILATVVMMIGGVMWIMSGGNASTAGEAKSWITASLTGLIITLTSYMILFQINPALVIWGPLKIEQVIPIPEDVKAFSEKCKPTDSGACAVSNMSGFGDRAKQASAICMAESSGNPRVSNTKTKCDNGDYYAVWGLFQFNLSANRFTDASGVSLNCPAAFNKTWVNSSPTCTVTDINLYNQCVAAATDAGLSILNAKNLVSQSSWGPWEANSKWCKFTDNPADADTLVGP